MYICLSISQIEEDISKSLFSPNSITIPIETAIINPFFEDTPQPIKLMFYSQIALKDYLYCSKMQFICTEEAISQILIVINAILIMIITQCKGMKSSESKIKKATI